MDWGKHLDYNRIYIRSCSDLEISFWNVSNFVQIPTTTYSCRDVYWYSSNCSLSWCTRGIIDEDKKQQQQQSSKIHNIKRLI